MPVQVYAITAIVHQAGGSVCAAEAVAEERAA